MGLLYEKESYEIRGACFWIWKEFGSAFKEAVAERAFRKELETRGLKVENQKRIEIFYKGTKVGTYIPDMVVNDLILIEFKAKPFLIKEDFLQFKRYLEGSDYKLGFLVNFGKRLEIKRYVCDRIRVGSASVISVRSAFTLVEVMVVIGISAVFTAMFLGYTRSSEKRIALFKEQAKVVGALERTKALAIQKYREGSTEACAFGIKFNKDGTPNTILIFQDLDNDPSADICRGDDFPNAGEKIDELALDARVVIGGAPLNPVVFKAPYLEVLNPGDIILQIRGNPGAGVKVTVGAGGGISTR